MTPRELKHFLDLQDIQQQALAEQIGCSPVELSQTINGSRQNPTIRKALAKALKVSEEKLFGPEHAAVAQLRKEKVA